MASGIYETRLPTEVAAAQEKLAALQIKHDDKRKELQDLQTLHEAAWKEYGSELCAGSMFAKEREVAAQLQSIADDIALLEAYLNGAQRAHVPEVEQAIAVNEERLERLRQRGESFETERLKAERLRQLLTK